MKIDVGHSVFLKTEAAITIHYNYPRPLGAAHSMSQSGLATINHLVFEWVWVCVLMCVHFQFENIYSNTFFKKKTQ